MKFPGEKESRRRGKRLDWRHMATSPRKLKSLRSSVDAKSVSAPAVSRDELLQLYQQMVLIRQFELSAQASYKRGELPGFIHLYIGEEAVAVGVCAHLRREDWITSTHRGHGHALAKGMPPRLLMAELFGKATGCCGGRGGSMHLYDRAHGVFGTNGIVGAGIPHAVGAALSARTRGTQEVAAAFFGDGAVNQGAFHESLNFAGARQRAMKTIRSRPRQPVARDWVAPTRSGDGADHSEIRCLLPLAMRSFLGAG